MYIKFDDIRGSQDNIHDLRIVGQYSMDGDRCYVENLSQLKYYDESNHGNSNRVRFNLEKDHDSRIAKPEMNVKIDFLLRWISNHFDDIKIKNATSTTNRWLEPEIICYRGLLTTLLISPYEKPDDDGWIICAAKFEGSIYLCSFDTDRAKKRKSQHTEKQKRYFVWGKKFEQYMLADSPGTSPNTSVPLNENEEFCCIFRSQLGNTSLLYGAEMDGVCSKEPFTDTLVEKEVEFIELKTSYRKGVTKYGPTPDRAFHALKWWCQSYLVGIQKIICGLKDSNIVKELREFQIDKFPHNFRYNWNDANCRKFCSGFLEKIKTMVREDHDKLLYKFNWTPRDDKIYVEELKPNADSEYFFLNADYIAAAKRYKTNCEG